MGGGGGDSLGNITSKTIMVTVVGKSCGKLSLGTFLETIFDSNL